MLKCLKTECVVCLEKKNKVISCRICYNTNVCLDCIHSMCEKGICKLCPICRQQDWKNIKKGPKTMLEMSGAKFGAFCMRYDTESANI